MERKMSFDTRAKGRIELISDVERLFSNPGSRKDINEAWKTFDLWVTISIQTFYTMMDGLETLIGFNAQSKDTASE